MTKLLHIKSISSHNTFINIILNFFGAFETKKDLKQKKNYRFDDNHSKVELTHFRRFLI